MKNNAHLSNLRIADLELLITANHLKSLGKAASLHHLSQSAASAAIVRVEQAFDKPLCTHEKRSFGLTKEGKELLAKAEHWLKELHEVVLSDNVLPIRLATTHAIARSCIASILPHEHIDVQLMRPDVAYGALLRDEADIAIVLDNAPWDGVKATEIGSGSFQLYSRKKRAPAGPVLLPEDQIEVLTLQQRFFEMHGTPLQIKARLPSWSLIADICSQSLEIGFLPDFLVRESDMLPVSWQPKPTSYRILALYKPASAHFQTRIHALVKQLKLAL